MTMIFSHLNHYSRHFNKSVYTLGTDKKPITIAIYTTPLIKNYLSKLGYASLLILLLATGTSTDAIASAMDEYNQKRKLALEKPNDPATTFEFAKIASKTGHYQDAISALQRILNNHPELSNIRLEIGVLYKRVGAYDLAEKYINEALKDPTIPPDVRKRAESILANTTDLNSPHSFIGSLSLSALYDTNANAGPSDRSISLNGVNATLSEDTLGAEDSSVELIGGFQYRYKLEGQQGNQLEADLLSYNRYYNQFSRLDTNLLDLTVGSRINQGVATNPSSSIKPYLAANTTYLGGDKYKDGIGGGLNFRKKVSGNKLAEVDIRVEDQRYSNSTDRPNASARTGTYAQIKGKLTHKLNDKSLVYGQLGASRRNSREDYESFDEARVGVGYQHNYIFGALQRPASTALSLELQNTNYEKADLANGFTQPREEKRATARLNNSIALKKNVSLDTSVSYTDNQSDIVLYDYDNWGASVGATFGF